MGPLIKSYSCSGPLVSHFLGYTHCFQTCFAVLWGQSDSVPQHVHRWDDCRLVNHLPETRTVRSWPWYTTVCLVPISQGYCHLSSLICFSLLGDLFNNFFSTKKINKQTEPKLGPPWDWIGAQKMGWRAVSTAAFKGTPDPPMISVRPPPTLWDELRTDGFAGMMIFWCIWDYYKLLFKYRLSMIVFNSFNIQ